MVAEEFNIYCELGAFEKADDPHSMRIGGIASTDALDADGERLIQEGLDFKPFLRSGWFNDNHGKKATDVVGYPTDAKLVKQGEILPNGQKSPKKGWWVEGYLLNTTEGRRLWQLAQSLQDTPRKLAFSVEGEVTKRQGRNDHQVASARVKNVAVTHCPKNPESELHALAKALTAGSPSSESFASRAGGTPGDGAPLSGGRGPSEDIEGDGDDFVVGDENEANGDPVAKSEDGTPTYESDTAYLEDWEHALPAAVHSAMRAEEAISKSEARIYLSTHRPDLGPAEIDRIIEHARSS